MNYIKFRKNSLFVENIFEEHLEIDVVYFENKQFSESMKEKWYSPIDRSSSMIRSALARASAAEIDSDPKRFRIVE